jgi:fibronectin type 3 domain-containing protein
MKNSKFLLPIIFFLLLGGCADFFQDRVPMGKNTNASLSDIFAREEEEILRLASPVQVYAADGISPREIKLGWSPVAGAASYLIERAVVDPDTALDPETGLPPEGEFEVLELFVSGTIYTDTILDDTALPNAPEYRNRYYYRIFAENNEKGIESSPPSEIVSASLFPPPSNVKASLGESTEYIRVRWNRMTKANSFQIFRSDNEHGLNSYTVGIVPGNQTWLTDMVEESEQGKDYWYSIVARISGGDASIASEPVSGFALLEGAPGAPDAFLFPGSGMGNSTDRIKIQWTAPGAEDYYYAVYRYSSEDQNQRLLTGRTFNTSYEDTWQLMPGVYYYYLVYAILDDDSGNQVKGPPSRDLKAFILSPPRTLITEKNGGTVSLKWTPAINVDDEFEGVSRLEFTYKIEGSDNISGPYTPLGEITETVADDGYVHAGGLVPYAFYRIVTINVTIESKPGNPAAPSPAAAVIIDASKAANIPDQSANASGVYPVRISWTKPSGENPEAYHVYRSASPDPSGFRKITGEPVQASEGSGGNFNFVDTTNTSAKPGRRFYYRVLSLNLLGQGSYYSESRAGYGALSYEQYMLEYNKTVKSSHKKMTYMNKPGSTDKLGSETKSGTISGSLSYNASIAGLGARILMKYTNYADFYINESDTSLGPYFILNGNTNTSASMDQSGTMDGTVTLTGMYPGKVFYDNIQIKGGAAGGGTYGVQPDDFPRSEISWTWGER